MADVYSVVGKKEHTTIVRYKEIELISAPWNLWILSLQILSDCINTVYVMYGR